MSKYHEPMETSQVLESLRPLAAYLYEDWSDDYGSIEAGIEHCIDESENE